MFVSAVQLNLKHCFSKKQFIDYIEKQVFNKLLVIPDIICFPENINYCLLFAKKETISVEKVKDYWLPISYPWSYLEANVFLLKRIKIGSF